MSCVVTEHSGAEARKPVTTENTTVTASVSQAVQEATRTTRSPCRRPPWAAGDPASTCTTFANGLRFD